MIELINETDFKLIDEPDFVNLAQYILKQLKVDSKVQLTIVFVDEETSAKLHVEWMDIAGPTDVLSFPVDEITPGFVSAENDPESDEPPVLGDVVICPTVASVQAKGSNHTPHEEMLLLLTHGILHLLGHDHAQKEEREIMFDLQRKLLLGFIAYRDDMPVEDVNIEGLPNA